MICISHAAFLDTVMELLTCNYPVKQNKQHVRNLSLTMVNFEDGFNEIQKLHFIEAKLLTYNL